MPSNDLFTSDGALLTDTFKIFGDVGIRTLDLRCRKQLLCHNDDPVEPMFELLNKEKQYEKRCLLNSLSTSMKEAMSFDQKTPPRQTSIKNLFAINANFVSSQRHWNP